MWLFFSLRTTITLKGFFVLQTSLEPQNYPPVSPLTLSWVRVVFLFAQSVALQSHSPRASDAHRKLVGGLTSREPQAPLWLCHWLRALGPPVLASCVAAAFPFCSVFMAARFAPFFFGLGIDKRKLTRPFPYSTTSPTSRVAVSLSKPHSLRDLRMRYRMSSWEYQAWSSSLNRKIKLKILNRGVLLLRLFSCDVRLYTTVASLCHFSTHSVLIRRSRARCALVQLRVCRTHHKIFFDTLATDNTLISVYTSTCQLIYDLIHEIASLLFLAARPPFPPEWR